QAPAGQAPAMPLAEFYGRHTFHGPRLRGIVRVDSVSDRHVAGVVRAARPGELAADPAAGFALDPLLYDSCLQLAAYWAAAVHGRGGLPLGVDELRVFTRVAPGAEVRCLLVFERSQGDLFSGHIDLSDASGALVAQLRGVRAELREAAPLAPVAPIDDIDPACYRVDEMPAYKELRQRLDLAQAMGISNPYFNVHERVTADTSIIGGREMLNFSSYNYLGLSGDEEVSRAVTEAVARYGTSVSASRVASGEKPLHRELEAEIASFLGCEDAIVMVGGHATNVGVVGHMFGPGDLIVHDSLAHDSILGGARLSGARRRPFPHNDPEALDAILRDARRDFKKVLIAVEGTYSMDGDMPPLPELIRIKRKHRAMMLVDEAHSLGVVGATGRGVGEHFGVDRRDVEMWMGTLSKSLASCGGYIAGSHALAEYLKYTMPGFVYSVGISPPNAASALAALRKLAARPDLVALLRQRAAFFLELLRRRGVDTGMSEGTAVLPCIVGNSWDCLQLAQALGRRGINVQPILYPAVEEHLARLRFFISARHSEEQLVHTADVLCEELLALGPGYLHRRRPLVPAAR
ncbi:MAG TPA: aminotransferase class I/II-fold pyridoxal phosphate-dependent enzyme, partial [Solirubrobacteraceae bacterium]